MTYVDGLVLPVKKRQLATYRSMAKQAGKVWRQHGALEFHECVGDDVPHGNARHFRVASSSSAARSLCSLTLSTGHAPTVIASWRKS